MKRGDIFKQVPLNDPQRNTFDLSHTVWMSGKFGYIYPCLLKEALPGDIIDLESGVFTRLAPMLTPQHTRVRQKMHFFAVPMRLLTNFFESKITGGRTGTENPTLPYVTPAGIVAANSATPMMAGSLWNHLGLPPVIIDAEHPEPEEYSTEQISVLPFRAYAKVFNDWYRDPNFSNELALDLDLQGNASAASYSAGLFALRQIGWTKDYFTSALAEAQRGAEVLMPLQGVAQAADIDYKSVSGVYNLDGSFTDGALTAGDGILGTVGEGQARIENLEEIRISNSATSINDFARSLAIQRWLETSARGGYRYVDQTLAFWNTEVPDFRLQRAEYLGGGTQIVNISPVVATANSTDASDNPQPLGDLAGYGTAHGTANGFKYHAREHMYILGVTFVTWDAAYWQGIDRLWTRKDRFDYAWPQLAHIGEQAILNKELYFSFDAGEAEAMNETFGYIPRFSEYKYALDRKSGDFCTTLGFWGLERNFTAPPVLGANFTTLREHDPDDEETYRRIFYDQSGTDYLWIEIRHNIKWSRKLPYFGVPSLYKL